MVEKNKVKYVALRFDDGQFIYFLIFPLASKSNMNFHNFKLTLLRESPWFLSNSTVVKKAQKNTLGIKRKRVW